MNKEKRQIAVIGGGMVGAPAAFYIKKFLPDAEVTLFDEDTGQAAKAAAGIISPWFSRRRNKKWYNLVKTGAAFYPEFIQNIGEDIQSSRIYRSNGTLVFKAKADHLDEISAMAEKRREDAPEIGDLTRLTADEVRDLVPIYDKDRPALYATGGARVHGGRLMKKMREILPQMGINFIPTKVETIEKTEKGYRLNQDHEFDTVVLATGAWMQDLLGQLDYRSDSQTQKGQLAVLQLDRTDTDDWPVIQPPSSKSVVPFEDGQVIIGATHEKDQGFNLDLEAELVHEIVDQVADEFSEAFRQPEGINYKVGIRGYTSDFAPYFGPVPDSPNLYAANGLGATGLTAGPLVGYMLAQLVAGHESTLPLADYPIENYIQR